MKTPEIVIIVESVNEAVRFYSEKLGFDLLEAHSQEPESAELSFARLKKGKFFIAFKTPSVAELAEFSFIKRCLSRCVNLHIELKADIEKVFKRYQKKNVGIIKDLVTDQNGRSSFALKDPFGVKISFVQQPNLAIQPSTRSIAGMNLSTEEIKSLEREKNNDSSLEKLLTHLKKFGIVRRSAKKMVKSVVKSAIQR